MSKIQLVYDQKAPLPRPREHDDFRYGIAMYFDVAPGEDEITRPTQNYWVFCNAETGQLSKATGWVYDAADAAKAQAKGATVSAPVEGEKLVVFQSPWTPDDDKTLNLEHLMHRNLLAEMSSLTTFGYPKLDAAQTATVTKAWNEFNSGLTNKFSTEAATTVPAAGAQPQQAKASSGGAGFDWDAYNGTTKKRRPVF